jgi:hypothetical protein
VIKSSRRKNESDYQLSTKRGVGTVPSLPFDPEIGALSVQ